MDEDCADRIASALENIAEKLNILNEINHQLKNLDELQGELVNIRHELSRITSK